MTPSADTATWWLRTSLGDLCGARSLLDADGVPARAAMFFAHQAAEKSLKAVIASGGAEPARTHDLVFLHLRCPTDVQLAMAHIDVDSLSAVLTVSRYPEIDEPPFDREQAALRVADAADVVDIAQRHFDDLGLHGSRLTPA